MSTVRATLLFGCALSLCLPAPEHLSMQSVNLHHNLSWSPGPGTPPGTSYVIYDASSRRRIKIRESKTTWAMLNLEMFMCQLTVVAKYNSSRSEESPKLEFSPYHDTKIDPPQVRLTACGACLHVSITMPGEGRGSKMDIHEVFKPDYSVTIRNQAEQESHSSQPGAKSRNFTLPYLRSGTEYCIQVHVEITLNPNTQPSAWTCAFTSREQPKTDPLVAGLVAGCGVFLLAAVAASAFCLKYMGIICKGQMMLPAVLLDLRRGYTLTPEKTVPDQMSISPKVEKHKHNCLAAPQPAEEEEEEEEEEEGEGGMNNYVVRNMELSSDQSLCSNSPDGLHVAHLPTGDPECDEDEDEGEEVGHSEVQEVVAEGEEGPEVEEREEEQGFNSSGEINLLSVTLGALLQCEEEEQTLEWTDQQALLSHDQTTMSVRTPVEDQSLPDEEEEEEEEFSSYLRHS